MYKCPAKPGTDRDFFFPNPLEDFHFCSNSAHGFFSPATVFFRFLLFEKGPAFGPHLRYRSRQNREIASSKTPLKPSARPIFRQMTPNLDLSRQISDPRQMTPNLDLTRQISTNDAKSRPDPPNFDK